MLHYLRTNERDLSDRAQFRLAELEREAGIKIPQAVFETGGLALHDSPDSKNSIDEMLAEVQTIQEAIHRLETKLKKLKP